MPNRSGIKANSLRDPCVERLTKLRQIPQLQSGRVENRGVDLRNPACSLCRMREEVMRDTKTYTTAGAGLLIGAGVGAGLMYLFDPNRGRARRAEIESRAKRLYHEAGHTIENMAKDIENRCHGMAAETQRFLNHEPVDAAKLTARVRAKLGHLIRKPHDVTVETVDGKVTLTGEIDADEAGRLLTTIMSVPGVTDVDNKLLLRHLETDKLARGAGAIASVAGGLITFAGIRAIKRAG